MIKKIKGVLRQIARLVAISPKQSFGKREVLGEGKTFDLTKGCPSPKNKEEDGKQEPVDNFTDKINPNIKYSNYPPKLNTSRNNKNFRKILQMSPERNRKTHHKKNTSQI